MMRKNDKIYVAGHGGMVGSALVRKLRAEGYENIVTRNSRELDLRRQKDVEEFFAAEQPDFVFLAAAKVGGIVANNTFRADFLYDNLMIESNIINSSYQFGVSKLLFLGSSCIYPKFAPQPIKEEYLLTGLLEPTNEPYAIAKIAGIKLCEAYRDQYGANFISAMPTNLYGPGDNYHPENSHVIPGLIRRFHEAKLNNTAQVLIWGTGNPLREFLYVEDLADACFHLMMHYNDRAFVNIGSGEEIAIRDLAEKVAQVVGYKGNIDFDTNRPDGTPRKIMDSSVLHSQGWKHKFALEKGLKLAYADFLEKNCRR